MLEQFKNLSICRKNFAKKKVSASGFDFSSYTSRIGKSTDIQYLSRNADTSVEKLALWSMFLPAILVQSLLNFLLY